MDNIEKYLKNNFQNGKKLSLDTMKFFINEYDNFEKDMNFIHIAGTNGKGSCVEMINNILIKQGYKVGKFISPHLVKCNERICINGKEISDKEMIDLIHKLQPQIDKYNKIERENVTFFELITIMALLYFYKNKVDFVVLETGLGGLYDCTNIISKPLISIITSIGLDHMHFLGNTLPKIASQKAGIIKKNSNTVFFEQTKEVNNIFINKCKKENNNLHLIKKETIKNYKYDNNFQYFDYKEIKNIKVNLKGEKQINNACICIETMEILKSLGYNISTKSIKEGLSTVIHKGRMETIKTKPLVIFDGAHNVLAIKNFKKSINMYYKNYKRYYIISILKRKDYKQMLKILCEDKNAIFILTSGNDENKFVSKEELYKIAKEYCKNNQKIYKKTIKEAKDFIHEIPDDSACFIVGSFYVYSDWLNL